MQDRLQKGETTLQQHALLWAPQEGSNQVGVLAGRSALDGGKEASKAVDPQSHPSIHPSIPPALDFPKKGPGVPGVEWMETGHAPLCQRHYIPGNRVGVVNPPGRFWPGLRDAPGSLGPAFSIGFSRWKQREERTGLTRLLLHSIDVL